MLRERIGCSRLPSSTPTWEEMPDRGSRQSAVLAVLCEDAEETRVLLIRRPAHMKRHGGEIAFPGGKREPGDRGPVETALREAVEELGLDPCKVRPCCLLEKEYAYSSDFEIHPVLATLDPGENPSPGVDHNEVEQVLTPSVAEFAKPTRLEWGNHGRIEVLFPVFEVKAGYRVWGATARILWQLGRILNPVFGESP